jgi:hypothetical protein
MFQRTGVDDTTTSVRRGDTHILMHHANINCVREMLIGQPAIQLVARCLVFLGICLLGKEVCIDEDNPENLEIDPLWRPPLPSCLSSNSCWYVGLPNGSCCDDRLRRLHDSMSWQPWAVMPCGAKGGAYVLSACPHQSSRWFQQGISGYNPAKQKPPSYPCPYQWMQQ